MWGDGRGWACADDAAVASAGLEPHPPRPAPGPEAWFGQDEAAVGAALAEVLDIQRAVAPDRAGAR
jgi:hypothetical protein